MAKTLKQLYKWAMIWAGGVFMCACSDEIPADSPTDEENLSEVQFLVKTVGDESISLSTRAGEEKTDPDPRKNFPVGYDFREGKSRIRVCSVSRDPNTSYRNPDMDQAFTSTDNLTNNPTRYHEYVCSQRKDYEEYSIFTTYKDAIPLLWDDEKNPDGTIKTPANILRTTVGGGYYLYAAMFPYKYVPPTETQTDRAVYVDQSYKETDVTEHGHYAANLLMSDFRFCQKMFGRDQARQPIRLEFYHCLCMLVVNVEIPRWATDGSGFTDEEIVAADQMTVDKVYRHFRPNYDKTYDRNDYVEIQTQTAGVEGQPLESLKMFHTPNFAVPSKTEGFVPEDAFWLRDTDHTGKESQVAWTQFCVILPPQSFSDTKSEISFNIGEKKYRCSLAGSPAIPLRQTYVTTLTLYIPREDSDPVIINAQLKDWAKHRTPTVPLLPTTSSEP